MATSFHGDYRVLVLAPFGKDAVLVREVLEFLHAELIGEKVQVLAEFETLPGATAPAVVFRVV